MKTTQTDQAERTKGLVAEQISSLTKRIAEMEAWCEQNRTEAQRSTQSMEQYREMIEAVVECKRIRGDLEEHAVTL